MALTGLVAANNLGDVVDIEKTWDNIGNTVSANVFVPSPTLDLNFASNKSLVDNVSGQNLITFSRASTGTFVSSNGLVQTAASGVPRFDHDPTTGESLGLLVEQAKTNECTYSNDFTLRAGHWASPFGTPLIATLNAGISPDGTNNAVLLSVANNNYDVFFRNEAASGGTAVKTFSIFLKAGTTAQVGLRFFSGQQPVDFSVGFNLANGTFSVSNPSIGLASMIAFPNGWYRCSLTRTDSNDKQPCNFQNIAMGNFYAYGAQSEIGSFPTSYIPTTSSTATRAADVASITGANFSSWYQQSAGTFFADALRQVAGSGSEQSTITWAGDRSQGFTVGYFTEGVIKAGITNQVEMYLNSGGARRRKIAFAAVTNNFGSTCNGASVTTRSSGSLPSSVSLLYIGSEFPGSGYPGSGNWLNGTIARITYYPVRLTNLTLQVLTTSGPVSSFPYSFSIKGRDILALKEVNKTSTRDFVFIQGLLSRAQPRLTTASQYTSSGVALRDAAMPKFAPITRGNYLFSSGLTLSGTTVQINGTNALSIATSPFSSSTATVPLLFAGLRPQANWRISETMASGVLASPESAIPIATGDFLLFMKAGQS